MSPRPKEARISEAALHKSVAAYLRLALKPPTIWTTIGHGGGGRVRGAQLKAMGVQKGWPDILIVWPDQDGPRVLGIELKRKDGRVTPEQRQMFLDFTRALCIYVVCRSLDEVDACLRRAAIPVHATLPSTPIYKPLEAS